MSQDLLPGINKIICIRKLDYFYIHINKNDKFDISYGSGLNQKMPGRCPLIKNLSMNLNGDNGNDLFSPSEY